MTNVMNEMICGTVDSTLDGINLNGDLKITKEGVISSINGGSIYDTTDSANPKRYIGSYNISPDSMDLTKRSISINVSDINLMIKSATTINAMLVDLETKYKPTV